MYSKTAFKSKVRESLLHFYWFTKNFKSCVKFNILRFGPKQINQLSWSESQFPRRESSLFPFHLVGWLKKCLNLSFNQNTRYICKTKNSSKFFNKKETCFFFWPSFLSYLVFVLTPPPFVSLEDNMLITIFHNLSVVKHIYWLANIKEENVSHLFYLPTSLQCHCIST